MQILLIEDDKSLATGVQEALKRAGLVVNWVDRGQAALQCIAVQVPDIVILDLGLPDMDGLSLLKPFVASTNRFKSLFSLRGIRSPTRSQGWT